MNYKKIDAALAQTLEIRQPLKRGPLRVFVRTVEPPTPYQADELRSCGVRVVLGNRDVFTAKLTPDVIARLSDQPWIRWLSLSRKLNLAIGSARLASSEQAQAER